MKIEITTEQFNVLFESLVRYQGILERDAAGLGRLDSREAYRKAEEWTEEAREIGELIQYLNQ